MKSKSTIIILLVILTTISLTGLSTQGSGNLSFAKGTLNWSYVKVNSNNDNVGMHGTAIPGNFNENSAKCCSDSTSCNNGNAIDKNGNANAGQGGIAIGGDFNGNTCNGGNANGDNGDANAGIGGKAFGGSSNGNSANGPIDSNAANSQ